MPTDEFDVVPGGEEVAPLSSEEQQLRVLAGEIRHADDLVKVHAADHWVQMMHKSATQHWKRAVAMRKAWEKLKNEFRANLIKLLETEGQFTKSGNRMLASPLGSSWVETSTEDKVEIEDEERALQWLYESEECELQLLEAEGLVRVSVHLTSEGKKHILSKLAKPYPDWIRVLPRGTKYVRSRRKDPRADVQLLSQRVLPRLSMQQLTDLEPDEPDEPTT